MLAFLKHLCGAEHRGQLQSPDAWQGLGGREEFRRTKPKPPQSRDPGFVPARVGNRKSPFWDLELPGNWGGQTVQGNESTTARSMSPKNIYQNPSSEISGRRQPKQIGAASLSESQLWAPVRAVSPTVRLGVNVRVQECRGLPSWPRGSTASEAQAC